jgi:hypothetical protein
MRWRKAINTILRGAVHRDTELPEGYMDAERIRSARQVYGRTLISSTCSAPGSKVERPGPLPSTVVVVVVVVVMVVVVLVRLAGPWCVHEPRGVKMCSSGGSTWVSEGGEGVM